MFVATIPSFDRPLALKSLIQSLAKSRLLSGVVVVADASNDKIYQNYKQILREANTNIKGFVYNLRLGRRGSVSARNTSLELTLEHFPHAKALVTLEDDCIVPSEEWLKPLVPWMLNSNIGIIGGRRINLKMSRIDPEVYLNVAPYLADVLTKLTGFIFLDINHGPRYVEYTTHLMAVKTSLIKEGLRYDPKYGGTGYREESDLQEQMRRHGYKIVFEPKFYVYHLNLEKGGDRAVQDVATRSYWKARNHTYFMLKHRKSTCKLILSNLIIMAYAFLHGGKAFTSAMQGLKEALSLKHSQR